MHPPPVPDPGIWVPAVGGSITVGFFEQPVSSAAPASIIAIDSILFIAFSIEFLA